MNTRMKGLERRLDAMDGKNPELPSWMRGMSCYFGKFVVLNLLRMALLELKLPATAETVNTLEGKEISKRHKGYDDAPAREAIQVREWFMEHSRVEDALRRLCGLEGGITVEAIERRMREVDDAIDKQYTEMEARIAARDSEPPEIQLPKTSEQD